MGSALFWIVFLVLPASAGLAISLVKPPEFVAWINHASEWWHKHYEASKAKDGIIAGVWSAVIWGAHKIHQWTSDVEDEANRAGIRFGLFFCVTAASLILIASLIYLVVAIGLIVAGLWVVARVLEDEDAARRRRQRREEELLRERRDSPQAARDGRSRSKTDWLGREYTEHRDKDGRLTGRSELKKDWLGNSYVETKDADGQVVETSRAREDWLGRSYVEHRDDEGDRTGESRNREKWFGGDYVEHRDADGVETGRSEKGTDWLGNDYVEHERRD